MASPSDPNSTTGPVVNGRYHLLSPLRRTTLSQDWLAHDQLLDRDVVFKALHHALTEDRGFIERFRAQAQSTASLTHPALAAVYDWGRDPNGIDGQPGPTYYLVAEKVSGRTIRDLIGTNGPMPIDRALHVLVGITSALGYAHRAEVIHGGLNPDVVTVNNNGVVKVSDTGLELALGPNWTPADDEPESAAWRAPEQFRGDHADARTDVYQIGLLAYFLTTGRQPFPGNTASIVAERHQNVVPPAPTKLRADIPKPFEGIIGRSLAKIPDERYSGVNEQRSALVRFRETRGGSNGSASATGDATVAPAGPDQRRTTPPSATPRTASAADATMIATRAELSGATAPESTMSTSAAETRVIPAEARSGRRSTGAVREDLAESSLGAPEGNFAELDAPKKKGSALLALTLLLLLAILGVLLFLLGKQLEVFGSAKPSIAVPSVMGKVSAEAESALSAAGLNVETKVEPNTAVPQDVVFDQRPSAGSKVAKDSKVIIFVSGGAAKPLVPNVVSETVDGAKAKLLQRGLGITVQEKEDDSAQPGTVISQEPRPETEVEPGTTVNVVVATSSGMVDVPDVAGQSAEDARLALSKALFRTTVQTEASATIEKGKVIRTEPAAGTKIERGAAVVIYRSGGNATEVPQLQGLSQSEAELKLNELGLKPDITTRPVSDQTQDGIVVTQAPAAGAQADPGATVSLRIGKYDASVKKTTIATTAPANPDGATSDVVSTTAAEAASGEAQVVPTTPPPASTAEVRTVPPTSAPAPAPAPVPAGGQPAVEVTVAPA